MRTACALLLAILAAAASAEPNASSMHATDVFSRAVVDENGEPLGHIEDLLLNERAGAVDYTVLAIEPDGKRFPYPLTAFRPTSKGEKLRLNVDRAALEASAGLAASGATLPGRYVHMRRLLGREVVFRGGERAGELRDFVVDLQTGQVRYAVIDYEPLYQDALLGVALSELRLPSGDEPIVLAREREPRPAAGLEVRPSDARRRLQSPFTDSDR